MSPSLPAWLAAHGVDPADFHAIFHDMSLEALAHDLVRFPALDVGYESDAASVVLVARVVQSLSLRQSHQLDPAGAAAIPASPRMHLSPRHY